MDKDDQEHQNELDSFETQNREFELLRKKNKPPIWELIEKEAESLAEGCLHLGENHEEREVRMPWNLRKKDLEYISLAVYYLNDIGGVQELLDFLDDSEKTQKKNIRDLLKDNQEEITEIKRKIFDIIENYEDLVFDISRIPTQIRDASNTVMGKKIIISKCTNIYEDIQNIMCKIRMSLDYIIVLEKIKKYVEGDELYLALSDLNYLKTIISKEHTPTNLLRILEHEMSMIEDKIYSQSIILIKDYVNELRELSLEIGDVHFDISSKNMLKVSAKDIKIFIYSQSREDKIYSFKMGSYIQTRTEECESDIEESNITQTIMCPRSYHINIFKLVQSMNVFKTLDRRKEFIRLYEMEIKKGSTTIDGMNSISSAKSFQEKYDLFVKMLKCTVGTIIISGFVSDFAGESLSGFDVVFLKFNSYLRIKLKVLQETLFEHISEVSSEFSWGNLSIYSSNKVIDSLLIFLKILIFYRINPTVVNDTVCAYLRNHEYCIRTNLKTEIVGILDSESGRDLEYMQGFKKLPKSKLKIFNEEIEKLESIHGSIQGKNENETGFVDSHDIILTDPSVRIYIMNTALPCFHLFYSSLKTFDLTDVHMPQIHYICSMIKVLIVDTFAITLSDVLSNFISSTNLSRISASIFKIFYLYCTILDFREIYNDESSNKICQIIVIGFENGVNKFKQIFCQKTDDLIEANMFQNMPNPDPSIPSPYVLDLNGLVQGSFECILTLPRNMRNRTYNEINYHWIKNVMNILSESCPEKLLLKHLEKFSSDIGHVRAIYTQIKDETFRKENIERGILSDVTILIEMILSCNHCLLKEEIEKFSDGKYICKGFDVGTIHKILVKIRASLEQESMELAERPLNLSTINSMIDVIPRECFEK